MDRQRPQAWGIVFGVVAMASACGAYFCNSMTNHDGDDGITGCQTSIQPASYKEVTSGTGGTDYTSDPHILFLKSPTIEQQAYMAYVRSQLNQAPFDYQFNVDTPRLGSESASKIARDASESAVKQYQLRTGLEIPQLHDLLGEYRQALAVYLEGTEPALRSYWAAKSFPAIPDSDAYNTPRFWERCTRTLRQSRLSTEVVVIRPRYLDGMKVPWYPDHGVEATFAEGLHISGIFNRPGRYPRTDDPVGRRLCVYEIIVGVEAVGENGEPFNGFLGLWMSYDYDAPTPRWVLSRIDIHNRPATAGVVMPNL